MATHPDQLRIDFVDVHGRPRTAAGAASALAPAPVPAADPTRVVSTVLANAYGTFELPNERLTYQVDVVDISCCCFIWQVPNGASFYAKRGIVGSMKLHWNQDLQALATQVAVHNLAHGDDSSR